MPRPPWMPFRDLKGSYLRVVGENEKCRSKPEKATSRAAFGKAEAAKALGNLTLPRNVEILLIYHVRLTPYKIRMRTGWCAEVPVMTLAWLCQSVKVYKCTPHLEWGIVPHKVCFCASDMLSPSAPTCIAPSSLVSISVNLSILSSFCYLLLLTFTPVSLSLPYISLHSNKQILSIISENGIQGQNSQTTHCRL